MNPTPQHAFHGGASFDAIGSDFADLARRHAIVDADVLDAWYERASALRWDADGPRTLQWPFAS